MIQARQRLLAHMRAFFENELPGLYLWDEVTHHQAEPAPRIRHNRRNPLGPDKELVTIGFGDYELTVASSEEEPPLGWITLMRDGLVCAEGPMDREIWKTVGNFIKGKSHVHA